MFRTFVPLVAGALGMSGLRRPLNMAVEESRILAAIVDWQRTRAWPTKCRQTQTKNESKNGQ